MESYSKWTFKTGTRATMLTGRVIYFGTLTSFLSIFAAKLDVVSDQYLSLLSKLHFNRKQINCFLTEDRIGPHIRAPD